MTSIKEAMELAGYVESLDTNVKANQLVKVIDESGNDFYFKKKPEPTFPKVFEEDSYKFIVENKQLRITSKFSNYEFGLSGNHSLPLLIEAVKYWEKHKDE